MKVFLRSGVLTIFAFLILDPASGIPRFAVKNGTTCSTCHVSPTGAGLRNDYGVSIFSMDELPLGKGMKLTDEDYSGMLGDHVRLGADFRLQMLSYSQGDTTRKTAVFPMQGDVYAYVNVSRAVKVYYKLDLIRGSPEFWTLLSVLPHDGYVKLGRKIPTYGLRFDDHTSFVRGGNIRRTHGLTKEGMPFSPLRQMPGIVEIGLNLSDFFLTGSVSNGYALGTDPGYGFFESLSDKNFTGRVEFSKSVGNLNSMAGASVMKEGDFSMQGAFGGLSLNRFTWVGELDLAKNWVAGVTSLASYSELCFEPVQGICLLAKYDFFDQDINLKGKALTRYTVGFELFPFSFLEVKAQARFTRVAGAEESPQPEYLLQFHTWL